jgi:hypothetical protein
MEFKKTSSNYIVLANSIIGKRALFRSGDIFRFLTQYQSKNDEMVSLKLKSMSFEYFDYICLK